MHELLRSNPGYAFGSNLGGVLPAQERRAANPLEEYFDNHVAGPGIWKWRHYFEIYHRHFEKFVGREVHVVEIGVYSGGSLAMWRTYFGPDCHVYGVDIEPACRAYADERVSIFVGDQGDPEFWRRFLSEVPVIDIVVDDGSHRSSYQVVTVEALLPRIRPGGVYLCEDVHHQWNEFHDYVNALGRHLHSMGFGDTVKGREPTDFQRAVHSIHLYPFAVVIEKRAERLDVLEAPRQGSVWQPFLDS